MGERRGGHCKEGEGISFAIFYTDLGFPVAKSPTSFLFILLLPSFSLPYSLCACRLHVHSTQALRSTAATGPVVGGCDDVVTAPRHRTQGTRQVPDLQPDRKEVSLRNRVRMKFKIKNKANSRCRKTFLLVK